MSESKRRPNKVSAGIMARQRIIAELRPPLKHVIEEFPYVTYCIDSRDLAKNFHDIIEKLGFIGNQVSSKDRKSLLQNLLFAFRKDNLILLQYRKKIDGSTITNILQELKNHEPYRSFKNIIPIFLASPNSKIQQQIFKKLSVFDIRHLIFLPAGAPVMLNVGTMLKQLIEYHDIMMKGAVFEPSETLALNTQEKEKTEVIERYKQLLEKAEKLMRSNPKKAIALFSEAIELKPDFDALMHRGDLYYKIEEYLSAFNDYKEAKELKAGEPSPYAKMSACCFVMVKDMAKAGNKDEAIRWFNCGYQSMVTAETILENVDKDSTLVSPGVVNDSLKHVMSALAEADFRDVGMVKESEMMTRLLSKVFHITNAVDFSRQDLDIDAQIDYAILLTRGRHYEQAEKLFRSIIKQDSRIGGPAFNNFAVELRKNGEYGRAFSAYIKVLRHEIPDRSIVLQNLVMAGRKHALELREESRLEEAVTVYKQILEYAYRVDGREWVLCDLSMTFLKMNDRSHAALRLLEAMYINNGIMESEQFEPYRDLLILRQEMIGKLSRGLQ